MARLRLLHPLRASRSGTPAERIRGGGWLAAAVVAYLALAGTLIAVGPGPNYDEALFQVGAVHMRHSRDAPPIIQPHGWWSIGGRSWPVMLMPYAGAISYYLLLPVFAVAGPGFEAARATAAMLAALGLWGIGRLAGVALGPAAAAVTVLLIAIHPGFQSNTVFNDSGFAYWMAALGAACLALRRYIEARTASWAAMVGLACGLGVWTRLNFAWLLGALVIGALAGFGRRAIPPARHLAAAAAGAIVGAAPLIAFQLVTRGQVTFAFMSGARGEPQTLPSLVWRAILMVSSLLYDSEHRHVWEGPPTLPLWQLELIAALVAASVLTAFVGRADDVLRRWHRATSIGVLVLAAIMIVSRLPVRGHHFVTLVPLAVLAGVLAARRLLAWRPALRPAVAIAAALYAGTALHWDWLAVRGLQATGGVGNWSDATTAVARYLDARRGGPPVRILDWGYDHCLHVITDGRVKGRELFWRDPYGPHAPVWRDEIVPGGVYLTHADPYLNFPLVTARYRQALARSGLGYTRLVFNDRRGRPHSELVEVAP